MKRLLLALALAVAAATPGRAADPEVLRVLEEAGILGKWALDCSRPASDENAWETIAVDPGDGEIRAVEDHAEWESVYRIVGARRVDARDVAMDLIWESGEDTPPMQVIYRHEEGRQKTWWSKDETGAVLIEDGKLVADGSENPWFSRCPG